MVSSRPLDRARVPAMEETMMTDHIPPARDQADDEIKRVLGQEMMSRRFLDSAACCPRLQSGVLMIFIGVLLLMVLQQVVSTDPAMQIAYQQRGAGAVTGAIAKPVAPAWERNDP
jgi:hypothetical protein